MPRPLARSDIQHIIDMIDEEIIECNSRIKELIKYSAKYDAKFLEGNITFHRHCRDAHERFKIRVIHFRDKLADGI